MLGSSSGVLETRTDNSTVEQHKTEEYFRSNNEVKNSVSTGHSGDQSKNPRDENFEMSQKTSIPREVDLGSITMEPQRDVGGLSSDPLLIQNPEHFVGALTDSAKVHFLTGSSYEGTWDALGMAGVGRYVLPNGTIYEGEIRDGMFHGQGSFYWSQNQRLDVVHFRGELRESRYEFQDGLNYEDTDWKYCKFPDRRFYESMKKGLKPGGRTRKTAKKTAKVLPAGCYDTGDGIFDPATQRITSYDNSKEVLRIASAEEYAWILKKCRKSWSEPTGYRPELNEDWSRNPPRLPYNLPMSQDSPDHWWKRLTTFTRDANLLLGDTYGGSELSSVDPHEILSTHDMCMCCGTVLIGEPCRCIHFYPSSHEQGEYDGLHRTFSEQVRENEFENCESSQTFLDSEGDFNRSETREYSASNIRKKIAEYTDESSGRLRGYKKMGKSIGSSEKAEPQYQEKDKYQKNKQQEESTTAVKSNEQNIQESHKISEQEMLQNAHEKNFVRNDDESSAIISEQIAGISGERNEDPSENTVEKIMNESLKNNPLRKSSENQMSDHSNDGLIPREKVSKETVPEASNDGVLEMKLLPENVTQQYGNQKEIKSTRRKSQRDFSESSEIEKPDKTVRQLEEEHSNEFSDKMIFESSGIREELIETSESNNKEPNEGIARDDNVENKSLPDEELLGKTGAKKTGDFIQNSQSIVKSEEKTEIHELPKYSKTNVHENLSSNPSADKMNLISTRASVEHKVLDSIPEKHFKNLLEKASTVELGTKETEHHGESSRESEGEKFDSNIEKVNSIQQSQSGVISDSKSTVDSEQILKDSISLSSKTNAEGPEVSGLVYEPSSAATLNLQNMEKSDSASVSSKLDKTKSSIFIERGQSTSLDRVHPSLASLKSTKPPLSKDKRLVDIYNKTSTKMKATNEPTNSNVWRLSSANENYGPETKIKNLLFNPALTAPRSENVVYVRRPCEHRACTTSIREVRATASRTAKEYSSDIPTKSMSADCNCKARQ